MENEYFASINEVSTRLGVPAHTLRYWEKQFPTAIRPTTGAGGRRYYRTETVERLTIIKELLYTRGMTIAGVKKLFRDGDFPKHITEIPTGQPVSVSVTTASVPNMPSTGEIKTAIGLLERARELLK
ncbi:MAG: MerR family transcriptional regulator [Alphaproteobacteria bacterium]|nr:MerR family transcriptional regulator [Alphaproteobacteria bacterium]